MRVVVTQRDIDKGRRARGAGDAISLSCPVAQALSRRFPGGYVSVGAYQAGIDGRRVSLPVRARAAIKQFDNGDVLKPFSFTIEVPA